MRRTQLFVGAVVRRADRVLLVRQSPGHSLQGLWTVPWGRVEEGESPAAAALREAWEEGGVHAEVEGLLGVQELPAPLVGGVGLVYLCRHVDGDPSPRDRETDAAQYFAAGELEAFALRLEPWSAWLVRRVLSGAFTVTRSHPDNPLQVEGSFL